MCPASTFVNYLRSTFFLAFFYLYFPHCVNSLNYLICYVFKHLLDPGCYYNCYVISKANALVVVHDVPQERTENSLLCNSCSHYIFFSALFGVVEKGSMAAVNCIEKVSRCFHPFKSLHYFYPSRGVKSIFYVQSHQTQIPFLLVGKFLSLVTIFPTILMAFMVQSLL